MRINSIHLQNFRQFKNERIEFTNVDKKVTIIHGKIHIGKTTLVKALLWCLYSDADNFKDDPVLVNRDLEAGYVAPGTRITVKVTIQLEHNGFDYQIETSQTFQFNRTETEGRFVATTKDPARRINRIGPDGSQLVLSGDEAAKEVETILPSNLKNYFFYDGENNKIDDIAQKSSLQDAVRNIMNLQIREEFIRYFSPTTKGRLRDRFADQKQSDDSIRAAEIQAEINDLKEKNEADEATNEGLRKQIVQLRSEVAELEARIEANAEAEDLQKKITEARQRLESLRRERDNEFLRLIGLFGATGSNKSRSAIANLYAAIAFRDANLAEEYSKLQLTEKSYSHQSAESIDEIIKKGICICGRHIVEGDEHYQYLIDQKNYVSPKDYSADLSIFIEIFQGIADSAGIQSQSVFESAKRLKQLVLQVERWETNLDTLSKQLGDFKGDIGAWKREADEKRRRADQYEARIQYSEQEVIPERIQKINALQVKMDRLASHSQINAKIDLYLAYVDRVLQIAQDRLAMKKEGVAVELQKEVNELYHAIIGSDVTELRLHPTTYAVDSFQDGKRIKLSTGQQTARNLAFVGGLIYLAKHKDQIGGASSDELDDPEDYPLVLDAPFSNLNEDDVVRVCTELPKYCGQLIITSLEKDYKNAINALRPYLDRSYNLVTNDTSTDSHFVEDNL